MMLKYNLRLAAEQISWLRARAQELGLTVSEVLRRVIDAARGQR